MIAAGISSPRFHTLSMRMAQAYLIESKASLILVDAGMPGDEQKARNAGCDGYLTKPIDEDTLYAEVARWLSNGA